MALPNAAERSRLPCPCGSGRLFRDCHEKVRTTSPNPIPEGMTWAVATMMGDMRRREEWKNIHGPMIPSVTTKHPDGDTLVSAGSTIYRMLPGETWYGFIYNLLRSKLGPQWMDDDWLKPEAERSLITQWFGLVQRNEVDANGQFTRWTKAKDTGSTLALRSLAYDVFCMEQGGGTPEDLLARLRNRDQFEGARYEAWAAATLVRAGWKIEFEDEKDGSTTHCEFTATAPGSGRKFSVECKRRHRPTIDHPDVYKRGERPKLDVSSLISSALRKKADHARIIFIDMNMPPQAGSIITASWINEFKGSKERLEQQLIYRAANAPNAILFATNHPYHYVAKTRPDPKTHFITTSFNRPDLYAGNPLLETREPEILGLMTSIGAHFLIPENFMP